MKNAISDYYRAYSQRSKWIREGLINPDEEGIYDAELMDYWEPKFADMQDDLESMEEVPESRCAEMGKDFYRDYYIRSCPQIYIRRVANAFLARGSSHILSHKKTIGWHPYYIERLKD